MSTPSSDPFDGVDHEYYASITRRYTTMLVASLSLIVLTCAAFFVPVPYVTMKPGPAFDTLGDFEGEPMFEFGEGVETYPTEGALDFTTVSVTRNGARLSLIDVMLAYVDGDSAVVPRSNVYPEGETQKQSQEISAAQLSGSKDASRVAALRAAGYTVPETPVVAGVVEGSPADGVLEADDILLAVDGTRATTAQAIVEAVGDREPGDDVTVLVRRDGADREFTITTVPADDDPRRPRVGVEIRTQYDFPIEIENNVGDTIGGPSAGTMFALAIYDRLTPGPLTGGKRVAGTGEIAADGRVGAIGGIRQKMAGAAKDEAEIFLVPAANCAEAARGDDFGMTLVRMEKLDDAISALEKLSRDADAKVPTC